MSNFKTRLQNRDYPARIVEKHLSEIKFSDREMSLAQKNKTAPKKILHFVTQYHPALPNLRDTLMGKWHLIENHLSEIKSESMGAPGRCATCDLSDFNETWPV